MVADYMLMVWFGKATTQMQLSKLANNQPQVPTEGDETGETGDQRPEEGDDDLVVTFSNLQVLTLPVKEEKFDWNESMMEGEAALEQALPESIVQQGPRLLHLTQHSLHCHPSIVNHWDPPGSRQAIALLGPVILLKPHSHWKLKEPTPQAQTSQSPHLSFWQLRHQFGDLQKC